MERAGRRDRWAWCIGLLGLITGLGADEPAPILQAPTPSAQAPLPSPQVIFPSGQTAKPMVPPGLPRYDIDARLDLERKVLVARERVRFTNRSTKPTRELVFHVYPRYKVAAKDRLILSKTLEMLRLSPEEAMDEEGRRLDVGAVRVSGRDAKFSFDPDVDTIMVVPLDRDVAPGASVEAEIEFTLALPEYWGRWGHHHGITYLLNWYPVLAHHDADGWKRTPFVPWHQPWYQEAGHYRVRIDTPENQVIASTGRITAESPSAAGRKFTMIEAHPARDFALVCSDRFTTLGRQVGSTRVRVHCFAENRENAERMLNTACEVIPLYERWFGPYYDDEFEIAPAFFGWNGNECSGLVLIDDRVMRLPAAGGRYLDHLITHETCHQWFWNVVGSDGYAETFMDEGLVNGFTALRLDNKFGRNAPLIVWPKQARWLPTIGREDLRLAGYYGWRARGGSGPVIQDLGAMGNLNTLFSLAYDRGGKVVGMIHNRLGSDRFFAFWQKIYHDYAWKTFYYADMKRELAAFDPSFDWVKFLDDWLVNHAETDWAVESVRVDAKPSAKEGDLPDAIEGRVVTVEVSQRGTASEPTIVMCRVGDREIRVPIWPDREAYDVPGAHVEPIAGKPPRWRVAIEAPDRPSQVLIDPDHALLDAVPDNNRWRPEVAWRVTPFMSPLDQAGQFQAYDRPTIVAGPFIDQYARGGFKVGAQRVDKWEATGWAGTEPALREAIFGGQAALKNFPGPNWSTGIFYEEGLYNFYNDQRHSGGRAFLRYTFLPTSSFLIDDQGFFEAYYGVGNEFWAGDDGRPIDGNLAAFGMRYRLSTLFPYWDPIKGFEFEATAEYGNKAYGSYIDYVRTTVEYGIVRPLPADWGWFGKTRVAVRGYAGYGSPGNAYLFRLGGGRRLRALDLGQNPGSSVWLGTFEWRFPIVRDYDHDMVDHVVTFKNILGAVFYDVGESYLGSHWTGVVHGVGVGLRVDTSLFSFLERASLRVDIAQPVNLPKGPIIWFGINQVF